LISQFFDEPSFLFIGGLLFKPRTVRRAIIGTVLVNLFLFSMSVRSAVSVENLNRYRLAYPLHIFVAWYRDYFKA